MVFLEVKKSRKFWAVSLEKNQWEGQGHPCYRQVDFVILNKLLVSWPEASTLSE